MSVMTPDPRLGIVMVLVAACLWGTTGTAQTFAGASLSSLWFGALRLAVAAAFFAAYGVLAGRRAPLSSHEASKAHAPGDSLPAAAVLLAGLSMAVYNLAFFAGVRGTGVAVGTAVALGSGPVWAGVLQSLLSRQAPPASWWAGTAVAVAGGVLMTGVGRDTGAPVSALGIGLCLLSGLSYAVYTLVNKTLVTRASAARVTFSAFGVAAVIALPAAWLESGAPRIAANDALAVLYVGVVTAGVAYLLFSHALRHISAATGVTLALGEPVMAFALAVLVVGERPGGAAVAGLLMVIGGVLMVVRAELRGARSATTTRVSSPA